MFIVEYLSYFIEYILRDPFTQVTGFMGMAVILTAYFQKEDCNVKKLMILSSFFWGAHFYLLGMYSGLAAIIIWVVRIFFSMKWQKSKNAFSAIIVITLVT